MNKILTKLISKKFSVYVGSDFERMTDFIGLMGLLHRWSDFFEYDKKTQIDMLEESIKQGYVYIDANIFVKIGR